MSGEQKKKVRATNDLAFKKAFGSEENKDILRGLIRDFFPELPTQKILLENPYSIVEFKTNEANLDQNRVF